MVDLKMILFKSEYEIDGNKETIEFKEKGYKKVEDNKVTIYFKNENSYKFIISNNTLKVYVNESVYIFDKENKTEAIIKNNDYSYKASLVTNKLNISDNFIQIEYELDFTNFVGKYNITLELL